MHVILANAIEFDVGPNVRFIILAILGAITSGGVLSVRKSVINGNPSQQQFTELVDGQRDILTHLDEQDKRIGAIETKLNKVV